ncbi:hypothetical protein HY636_02375 [Candidatus Woesearchaeota archaeon]|nr:hypothetical protein [Candidatus Woesearchaeota archaeon]
MQNMQLSQEYHAQQTLEGKISVLQKHYGLEKVDIDVENLDGFLGLRGIGSLYKTSKGYKIKVIGKHYVDYLGLHEFLHIWLEETGRTFSVEQKDKGLEEYLYHLKNMFNDYLIETEINRQFGEDYVFACKDLRDYDLRGQFMGVVMVGGVAAPASAQTKLMLALTCRLVSEVYPSMADSLSRRFVDCLNWFMKGEFMEIPSQYNSNVSPEQYLEGINSLNHSLTGSRLEFIPHGKSKRVRFKNPIMVKQAITNFKETYEQIVGALRNAYGKQQHEDTRPTHSIRPYTQ